MKLLVKKLFKWTKVLVLVMLSVALLEVVQENVQAQTVAGGGYYTPFIVVNSAVAPGTNVHFGIASNGYYPIRIQGGEVMTNFAAKADVSAYKDISIQVTAASDASIGAVTAQTAIFTVYRSLESGTSTNWLGGNLHFDTLGTITLPMTTSTSGPWTVISNYCNLVSPIAGVTTLYVSKLDLGAMTNGVGLTNYTVRINGK